MRLRCEREALIVVAVTRGKDRGTAPFPVKGGDLGGKSFLGKD